MDIKANIKDGTTIVYFIGRLDITAASEIENKIDKLIDNYPNCRLYIRGDALDICITTMGILFFYWSMGGSYLAVSRNSTRLGCTNPSISILDPFQPGSGFPGQYSIH